ncbi:MFS transporter [Pseudonocardia bannensis]|uniref:MFS transporter n=1 Tax=Pseudonocardia bannensis TaxID=630973 RepID=A0A848DGG8_9PSEU|nr:MFS transporter [Pseudonocardia bannensis]NMH91758.1 MFS transporter [Pseudonocardia bannensis]
MRPWVRVVAVLFTIGYGANQFSPLMVMYREQSHFTAVTVAAFFGVYVAGLAPGLLIGGPASNRWGRRRLLLPCVIASVPASAVLALGGVDGISEAALYTGRFLFGVVIGVAMTVGSTWVKELSQPPWDPAADEGSGARRAALALSAGFGVGPAVGGSLAQWAPLPMELPYLVHIVITIPAIGWLLRTPETRPAVAVPRGPGRGTLWSDLAVPAARQRRFLRLVVPAAPWAFGAPSISFAVQPVALGGRTAGFGLIFATLLTALTLAAGVGIQSFARRLDRRSRTLGLRLGLALVVTGTLLAAGTAASGSLALAMIASVVLGAGFGISLVSGLLEVQRIARPEDLAGLTAVYYGLTYIGFGFPMLLAGLTGLAGYPVLLVGMALLALLSLVVVTVAGRRVRQLTGVPQPVSPES